MQIAPIHEIAVFDTAKLGGRGKRTLVSLNVDGVTVYSKSVVGFPVVNCGTNTVGAFHSDKKESLFAWIDPVSKEFLITSDAAAETVRPYMLLPGLVIIAVAVIAKMAGLWESQPFLNLHVQNKNGDT